jgi:hypothetical protein
MLYQEHRRGKGKGGSDWKKLERFFSLVVPERCAFLSMNWDTVIEEGLEETQLLSEFDYGCDAQRARFKPSNVELVTAPLNQPVQLLKPHGSINWLYCDACRQVFWFPPGHSSERIARQLFRASDWEILSQFIGKKYSGHSVSYSCPLCNAEALGTRLATFSYRKALEFPMHESSWRSAERLLREANSWIFVGYSLPSADYEFKQLLKRVQLSRVHPPELVLITGGKDPKPTCQNYQKFFGRKLNPSSGTVFVNGLEAIAIKHLQNLGVLSPGAYL